MEVFFMRIGVQSAVLKETPKWKERCALRLVKQWDDERDEQLIGMALGMGGDRHKTVTVMQQDLMRQSVKIGQT